MTEPQEPTRHEVHVTIAGPPIVQKAPKSRKGRDCLWVVFAAALIGTAIHSSVVFAVVACVAVVLVIVGNGKVPKGT